MGKGRMAQRPGASSPPTLEISPASALDSTVPPLIRYSRFSADLPFIQFLTVLRILAPALVWPGGKSSTLYGGSPFAQRRAWEPRCQQERRDHCWERGLDLIVDRGCDSAIALEMDGQSESLGKHKMIALQLYTMVDNVTQWDDYIVILALILSWGLNILNLAGIRSGFGRHILDLIQFGPDKFFRYMYAFEILYVFAMSSVKFSIIVFQYRIFPVIKYRRVLVMWGAFTACLTISSLLVCIFQCIPVYGFWTTFAGKLPGAKCVDVVRYIIIAGSINAATDFILLGLVSNVHRKLSAAILADLNPSQSQCFGDFELRSSRSWF